MRSEDRTPGPHCFLFPWSCLRTTNSPSLISMRVLSSLFTFIFVGVASAGIIAKSAVPDDTGDGDNDLPLIHLYSVLADIL